MKALLIFKAAAENSKVDLNMLNRFIRFTNAKLFLKKTVEQLITGYSDSIIKIASLIQPDKLKDGKFSLTLGVSLDLNLDLKIFLNFKIL